MSQYIEAARGGVVVAGISGGKDSAALSLWLTEQGVAHRRVFADTGWEHPATYEHLAYLEGVLGPIDRVQCTHGGMVDLVRKRGMFPSRLRRFCTQELKAAPIRRYLSEHEADVNVVGIRASESASRARMAEWEWSKDFDCNVWRPLLGWSEDDVIAIHKRHGVRPNPLYLMGASRVGCWPCIFARKAEVKLVVDTDPARIALIAELEAEVEQGARERAEAKGEEHTARTFFHSRGHGQADNGAMAIGVVAEWAKTDRGGRQLPLFEDAPDDGCVRWGLCETGGDP